MASLFDPAESLARLMIPSPISTVTPSRSSPLPPMKAMGVPSRNRTGRRLAHELGWMVEVIGEPRKGQQERHEVESNQAPDAKQACSRVQQPGESECGQHQETKRVRIDQGGQTDDIRRRLSGVERVAQGQQQSPAETGHEHKPGVHASFTRIDDEEWAQGREPGCPQSGPRVEGGAADLIDQHHSGDSAQDGERPSGEFRRADEPEPDLE